MLKVNDKQAIQCFVELRSDHWAPFRRYLEELFNENVKLVVASRDDTQTHRVQGQLDLLLRLMDTIENADRVSYRSK